MANAMCQNYCSYVNAYSTWLVFAGAVLLGGLLFAFQHRGRMLRRERFDSRPSLTEAEWFAAFYPVGQTERVHVRDALKALADDIGIEWTKLRPTDTFEEFLRVDRRYLPCDDLEEAEFRIVARAEELGFAGRGLPGFIGALRDFLDHWVTLCGGEPPAKPVAVATC